MIHHLQKMRVRFFVKTKFQKQLFSKIGVFFSETGQFLRNFVYNFAHFEFLVLK